jgi:hypothetical protein
MESWEDELERSLGFGLGFDEEMEEEFENDLFIQMVDVFSSEVLGESSTMPKVGGSTVGREFVWRDREHCHNLLYNFSESPTYGPVMFRRHFRMRRELFTNIVHAVVHFDPWFKQRPDATGRMGLSSLQKCTAAIRMLAYGVAADACVEYCKLGESTTQMCMERFVVAIRGCFEATYLRQPTRDDI